MTTVTIAAEPASIDVELARTALVIIDMQRDFLLPGGFGEALGNDVSLLGSVIAPCKALLEAARACKLRVIHTREGHRPDMADTPRAKVERGAPSRRIGDPGPMGRILIRGEPGHEIVDQLCPHPGEPVIDKPGKGAFYGTDLGNILQHQRIENLIVCGVTTEVCVHTTVREANDRGFRCIVPGDCCGSYFPEFHDVALRMIKAQGGIFGWVTDSARVLTALR
jgi:nicotinamidase-related amidase